MKKRKLGSKNPRYAKTDQEAPKIRREFVSEVKGVKIYTIYYI
jgi:hypothetical protein